MRGEMDFKEIYNKFQPKIFNYVSRMTGPQYSEDITQEVFEKVSHAIKDFQGKSKLSTWLYRIATNTALDRLKSSSFKGYTKHTALEDATDVEDKNVWTGEKQSSADQGLIRKEMNECIREYIEKLPPDYKTVIILSELEGFTNQELADIIQVSLNTVKIRLHRARTHLKKELDNGCDFYHNEKGYLACDRKSISIKPKQFDKGTSR